MSSFRNYVFWNAIFEFSSIIILNVRSRSCWIPGSRFCKLLVSSLRTFMFTKSECSNIGLPKSSFRISMFETSSFRIPNAQTPKTSWIYSLKCSLVSHHLTRPQSTTTPPHFFFCEANSRWGLPKLHLIQSFTLPIVRYLLRLSDLFQAWGRQ